jgi:hypothetical protein
MMCNDKIKITGYAVMDTNLWNKIFKQATMKKEPNPALKNTAIFVGNDAELRKKAIEYYESEGYKYNNPLINHDYISTFRDGINLVTTIPFILKDKTIITLPTEPKSEYPKWMLVSMNNEDYVNKLIEGEINGVYLELIKNHTFYAWLFAKDLQTVTITQSELIEAYENKMNKGKLESRISDLEHQFKQLEHNYREACFELADRDNDKPLNLCDLKKGDVIDKNGKLVGTHVESTQELFKTHKEQFSHFQELFEHLHNEHGLILVESEMWEIINIVRKIDEKERQGNNKHSEQTTPDPITSTTLKTPNEWLKLMSEEEVRLWRENRSKSEWELDMEEHMTFTYFIQSSFRWIGKAQEQYWQNIALRYNN